MKEHFGKIFVWSSCIFIFVCCRWQRAGIRPSFVAFPLFLRVLSRWTPLFCRFSLSLSRSLFSQFEPEINSSFITPLSFSAVLHFFNFSRMYLIAFIVLFGEWPYLYVHWIKTSISFPRAKQEYLTAITKVTAVTAKSTQAAVKRCRANARARHTTFDKWIKTRNWKQIKAIHGRYKRFFLQHFWWHTIGSL